MSGRGRNDEEGGGGGWASTIWKVAGAAAATLVLWNISGKTGTSTYYCIACFLMMVLRDMIIHFRTAHTNEDDAVVWTKPKVGWVKLNVNGSLLREILSAGCGGVLRDASGKWMCGFAQKLSPSLREDEVEKEAILKGLQWAHGKGVTKLEVESDNEGIVNKVNSGSRSNEPLIRDIRKLLNDISLWQQATLTWIPGDANQVADKLADIAHSFTFFDLEEYDSPPKKCLTALKKDSKEGEGGGGGWASMLFKIAGAAVATGAGGSGGVHSTDQEGAVWTKPMMGWVKLNVDGSLLPHIPSAGCGGVLRDSSGKWMDGFAQRLSPSLKVDEAEEKGILIGLQWACGKGVKKVEVESDNKGIVYTVNSGRSTDPLIFDIRKLLHSPHWEAKLTSIRREANQVADKVADNSHDLTSLDDLHEFGPYSPPKNCLYALNKDAE